MTWIELLRRQLPLADFDEIFLAENWCPAAFFGVAAPSLNTGKCGAPEVCLKRMCWTKDVAPEVLAAHGVDELDRLRTVAEAAKRYLAVKKSWDNRLPDHGNARS